MSAGSTTTPILVTGSHRSGSTWVGRLLRASGDVAYIHEPMNLERFPRWRSRSVMHWYEKLPANSPLWWDLDAATNLLFPILPNLRDSGGWRQFASVAKVAGDAYFSRLSGRRALIKDPFMLFNAAAFSQRYQASVVLTVRSPAAFASSLKRLGWAFDFQHLASQTELMNGDLAEWSSEIEEAAAADCMNLVEQAALLWRVLHGYIWKLSIQYPDFHILIHEKFALSVTEELPKLYANLGLTWNRKVERRVAELTRGGGEDSAKGVNSVKRNSLDAVQAWRRSLSPSEVSTVDRLSLPERRLFYA